MFKKINKSYINMTKEEKEYLISIYYNHKDLKKRDITKLLGISDRTYLSVMKEFNINSKLKTRYTINENYFESIDTEQKAYILGFIYADGYLGDEKTNNLIIGQSEKVILEKIAKEMNYNGEIKKRNKGGFENSKESYVLNFSNKKIANDLRKLGVFNKKSLVLNNLPIIPTELYRHFLRGYFDGDGSITRTKNSFVKKDKRYEYEILVFTIIATKPMLKNIVSKFDIKKYHIKESKTKELFYIQIKAKDEIHKLYRLMYEDATIYLNRKYKVWNNEN